MKFLLCLVFILFGTLLDSGLNGQSVPSQLRKLDDEANQDSAYLLIEKYVKIYEEREQWDSIVYLLHQKANLFFRFESIEEVHQAIIDAEAVARKYLENDNPIFLILLNFKSSYYSDIGDYKTSEKILKGIIQTVPTSGDETEKIIEKTKSNLAFLYLQLGRVKESEALASSIYEKVKSRKDTSKIVSLLQSLIIANHWLNKYDKALVYAQENLNLVEKFYGKKHPNYGLSLSRIAGIYEDNGKVNKAIEYYNRSKDIHLYNYEKTGVSRFLGSTVSNIGNYYSTIGEYRLAIDHMTYGLEMNLKEYGENSFTNMWHYSVLSTSYRLYKDYDMADYFIDKAFDLIEISDQSSTYDKYLFQGRKAEMLYARDKYDEAIPMALEVYDYFNNNKGYGSTNDRLHILNLISNIYLAQKDYDKAYEWAKLNQAYHRENLDPLNELRINVLNEFLPLLTNTQNEIEAYKVKDEILKIRNKGNDIFTLPNTIPNHELLVFSANWTDFLLEMTKQDEAYKAEYFEFLVDFQEYYSIHLATVKTNSNLAANETYLKRIFYPAIYFLHESEPEKALLMAEKCKSFSTRQILQSQLIDDPNLPTLDYMLDNSTEDTKESMPADVFFNITASLDSVALYKDSLFNNDRKKFEKYFGAKDLSMNEVRGLLDEGEMMVEYFRHDSLLFAFYIDKSNVDCKAISYPKIETMATDVLDNSSTSFGGELRALLLPDDKIENFKKLKILPDGILNSLSFGQLFYKKKPLIYSKIISYGLSASVLIYQEKLTLLKKNKNQFLGLTPGFTKDLKSKMESEYSKSDSGFYYLLQQPFLLSLSESLSRDFSGEVYKESSATENVFKSQSQDYQILHIATHGILDNNSPLFSKLIFAKDSIEDGYLHAYELYGKNLNADLAVLSACSSGKEKTYASEGVVSLSQAFTHAGCPSVLMTKWDVDEKSTSVILKSFYENLKSGKTKSEALRNAKLSFLDTSPESLHDPYYWAGLVLIGDDTAMFSQVWYKTGIGMISIIGLILLFLFWGYKTIWTSKD